MSSAPRRALPRAAVWVIALELAILTAAAVWALSEFTNFDPALRLRGMEFEYLTSSAVTAAQAWHEHGYIPLWQPFFTYGEPLIEWGFSSVLNPFITAPVMLFGAINGIKISLLIHAIIAAIGGWALGRVLGLGTIARMLLGALMLGRGSAPGLMSEGLFQLAISQAYMPYALAAAVGLIRFPDKRYPIILMGAAFALLLYTGNIYYILPTALIVVSVVGVYALHIDRDAQKRLKFTLDRPLIIRFAISIGVAVLFSAATLFPQLIQSDRMGGHLALTPQQWITWQRDLISVTEQFFNGTGERYANGTAPGAPQYYHTYVLPIWFTLAIFVLLPPIRSLHQESFKKSRRLWWIAFFWIVFFILWGAAQNPLIIELAQSILPILGRWRFPGRILSVAAFLIALLAALRVDGLWRSQVRAGRFDPELIAYVMGAACIIVAYNVIESGWKTFGGYFNYQEWHVDECIDSIQAAYPGRELNIVHLSFDDSYAYVERHARLTLIGTGIRPVPITPTLFPFLMLHENLSDFALAFDAPERRFVYDRGFVPIPDSLAENGDVCGYVNPNALPYAFTIPLDTLTDLADQIPHIRSIPGAAVAPLTPLSRIYDQVTFAVTGDAVRSTVVVAREVAYPGWYVEVNGNPARLESVGGLIGVVLEPGETANFIHFYYRPPLLIFSMIVTILSGLAGIAYLLRVDSLIRLRRPLIGGVE